MSDDSLVWDETFAPAIPAEPERKKPKSKKVRLKKCSICRQTIESDGYGEWVHSSTGLYGEYDERGGITHVATK